MSDHLHEQQRTWSPGQAVTPGECGCDDSPDFVSDAQRALEARGHERVNRHAAPCMSCQAGLCGEHGPARVETTTGEALHSVDCGTAYRGCAPDCPKDLAEPRCHCGAYATSDDDKTCMKHTPLAPAAEATGEIADSVETLGVLAFRFVPSPERIAFTDALSAITNSDAALRASSDGAHRDQARAEVALGHARAETERWRDRHAAVTEARDRLITQTEGLLAESAALRTRAREAEERAEKVGRDRDWWRRTCEVLTRERDEAREQRDAALDAQRLAERKVAGAEAIATSARARADRLELRLADVCADRERKVSDLAAANARAEEAEHDRDERMTQLAAAEEELRKSYQANGDQFRAMNAHLDTERAARVKAEAEVSRLRECHRTAAETVWDVSVARPVDVPELDGTDGAHPAWWRGCDHGVRKAAESILEALGTPQPDRLTDPIESVRQRVAALRARVAEDNAVCLCGCPADQHEDGDQDGESCGRDDHECLRVAPAAATLFAALRERCRRLEEALDMLAYDGYGIPHTWPSPAIVAAAKGEVSK